MNKSICPHCDALVEVEDQDLDQFVECGYCAEIFTARRATNLDRNERLDRIVSHHTRESLIERDPDAQIELKRKGSAAATTSLVLGLISVVITLIGLLIFCPFLGAIPGVVGIVFGFMGMKTTHRGMSIGGLVLSVLGAFGSILLGILICAGVYAVTNVFKNTPPPVVNSSKMTRPPSSVSKSSRFFSRP